MGYHIYAIGKAIRALFVDRVTFSLLACKICEKVPFCKSSLNIVILKIDILIQLSQSTLMIVFLGLLIPLSRYLDFVFCYMLGMFETCFKVLNRNHVSFLLLYIADQWQTK